MFIRKFIVSSSLAAMLLVPLAATARSSESDGHCALAAYKITEVAPYRVQERAGRWFVSRLVGAKLFVPAQPGLTPEWIRATLERHIQAMGSGAMPGCPLAVGPVTVTVQSGGNGYWVQIAGKDPRAGEQILAQARHLVR